MLSSSLGRPLAIHEEDIDLIPALDISDADLDSWNARGPLSRPPSTKTPGPLAAMRCLYKLQSIVGKGMRLLYGMNRKGNEKAAEAVCELDSLLNECQSFPAFFSALFDLTKGLHGNRAHSNSGSSEMGPSDPRQEMAGPKCSDLCVLVPFPFRTMLTGMFDYRFDLLLLFVSLLSIDAILFLTLSFAGDHRSNPLPQRFHIPLSCSFTRLPLTRDL